VSRYISENMRQFVAQRANFCCEYCLISEIEVFYSFEIDHIISLKHGGKTLPDNLAFSCFPCNNSKGSDVGTVLLPILEFVRFFNQRMDKHNEHFDVENGVFYAKTSIGDATIKILNLNDIDRIIERTL
jgi:hypothetical protein